VIEADDGYDDPRIDNDNLREIINYEREVESEIKALDMKINTSPKGGYDTAAHPEFKMPL